MKKQSKLNILLPIETSARELIPKLYMSSYFANMGYRCYIGDKSSILKLANKLDNSIYFDKGYHKGVSDDIYKSLKNRKVRIFSLDEENAVDFSDYQQINIRFPDFILSEFEYIFLWGEKQYNYLKNNRNNFNQDKIYITGHPRFDLLKEKYHWLYETEKRKILSNFKKFILINSNFGLGNNIKGENFVIKNYSSRFPQLSSLIAYHKLQVNNFIELAIFLAKNTNMDIVYRPHPEESKAIYLDAFIDIKNIHVIFEGSVIPWILASSVMVHHDCTTSLECAMLGKSSIAYTKDLDKALTTEIPLNISYVVNDLQAILELINGKMSADHFNKDILNEYFTFNKISLLEILDRFNKADTDEIKSQSLYLFRLKEYMKTFIKFFISNHDPLAKNKLDGLNFEQVKKIIESFNRHDGFDNKTCKVTDRLFKIERNSK